MILEFSAGIVVYRMQDGKRLYLALKYAGGHWDLAKGHIEAGENKIQAARRELQEETGIEQVEIDPTFEHAFEYYFKSRDGNLILKKVYFFVGKTAESEVVLSHEHQGYEWLPFKDAVERMTYKNAQDLLRLVDDYLK